MNHDDVKILKEDTLYEGFLTLKEYQLQHKRFQGDWTNPLTRELLVRADVAAALLYDPILNQVVLIEQFRIGALHDKKSPWLVEVVAGSVKPGEEITEVIVRETKEETGLTILDLHPIYQYWVSPGGTNENVTLFVARVDAASAGGIHGVPEEHEDIRVIAIPLQDAMAELEEKRINNATTLIALQWLYINWQKLREKWR